MPSSIAIGSVFVVLIFLQEWIAALAPLWARVSAGMPRMTHICQGVEGIIYAG
jgi:hypothetical protein